MAKSQISKMKKAAKINSANLVTAASDQAVVLAKPEKEEIAYVQSTWTGGFKLARRNPVAMDVEAMWRSEEVELRTTTSEINSKRHCDEPQVVAIVDIAKPAKIKGIAKDFVVVERMKPIIALGDEDEMVRKPRTPRWEEENDDEDEWEVIPDTRKENIISTTAMSYSAVLKGNDG